MVAFASTRAFVDAEKIGQSSVSLVSALGSSGVVGEHLTFAAKRWSERPFRCQAQLNKVGMSREECEEVHEFLEQLSREYKS